MPQSVELISIDEAVMAVLTVPDLHNIPCKTLEGAQSVPCSACTGRPGHESSPPSDLRSKSTLMHRKLISCCCATSYCVPAPCQYEKLPCDVVLLMIVERPGVIEICIIESYTPVMKHQTGHRVPSAHLLCIHSYPRALILSCHDPPVSHHESSHFPFLSSHQ